MAANIPQLPQGYHQENFLILLNHVEKLYKDLLLPEEQSLIQAFNGLEPQAQSLYVRLVMRKGALFRTDALKYADIDNLDSTLTTLGRAGFINVQPKSELADLLPLCLKGELVAIATKHSNGSSIQPTKLTKSALIDHLISNQCVEQLRANINDLFFSIERLHDPVIRRFQLLFFGNARQGLTEFITQQLGIIEYENYRLDDQVRFFNQRERLDYLEQLSLIREWQENHLSDASAPMIEEQLQDCLKLIEALGNKDAYLKQKTERTVTRLARQLERLDPDTSLNYYRYSSAPPSRERQARILEKQNQDNAAYQLILETENNPQHPDEAEKLQPLKKKLIKKLKLAKPPSKETVKYPEDHIMLPQQDINIEAQVAEYLSQQDCVALHLENHLFLGLFGLLFWDIIFSPCKDAFYNAFQIGPRDLWEPEFLNKREHKINERLLQLNDETWKQTIINHGNTKRGKANYFVNWQVYTPELVNLLAATIPSTHLSIIFRKMLENLGYYRNGFPDLVVLKADGYHLWEVKGPTDSLQPNQTRWLSFFQNHEIPAGVIYVEWKS